MPTLRLQPAGCPKQDSHAASRPTAAASVFTDSPPTAIAAAAESIISEEVDAFLRWWDSLDALPTVRAICQNAEGIRRREVAKALAMLNDVSPQNRQVVDALTRSIVNKILHDPTVSLKQGANKTQIRAARNLFRVEESD